MAAPSAPASIRAAVAADAAEVAAVYAPSVVAAATSFELEPPGPDEMERRIVGALERFPWLVCVRNDRVLGFVRASRFRDRLAYQWSAETSAYVRADVHRAGVGRALYSALLPLLVQQGYYTAYAGITLPNAASVGLHESLGFTPVGVFRAAGHKFGAWHDVGWWQRPLQPYAVPPAAPRPFSSLADSPESAAALRAAERLLRL